MMKPATFISIGVFASLAIISMASAAGPLENLLEVGPILPKEMSVVNADGDLVAQLEMFLSQAPILSKLYENYKKMYKSNGTVSSEGPNREATFSENLMDIAKHNEKNNNGENSWRKGVNSFTDMNQSELKSQYANLPPPPPSTNSTNPKFAPRLIMLKAGGAPASLDWRSSRIVTPVKHQGQCGSCASFTVAATVESAIAKKTRKQLDLSEQELVDCAEQKDGKGTGCNGYWYTTPLDYIKSKSVTSEVNYKYEAKNNACRASGKARVATLSSYGLLSPQNDENALKEALYQYGPMTAYVNCGGDWFSYKKGVFKGNCGDGAHAITLTGYGREGNDDFWWIKNSWGTGWGESGFMKILRGSNKCIISSYNYYVIA